MNCNETPNVRRLPWRLLLMTVAWIALFLTTSCASSAKRPALPVVLDLPPTPSPPLPSLEPRLLPPFEGTSWRDLLAYTHQLLGVASASEIDKSTAKAQLGGSEDVRP